MSIWPSFRAVLLQQQCIMCLVQPNINKAKNFTLVGFTLKIQVCGFVANMVPEMSHAKFFIQNTFSVIKNTLWKTTDLINILIYVHFFLSQSTWYVSYCSCLLAEPVAGCTVHPVVWNKMVGFRFHSLLYAYFERPRQITVHCNNDDFGVQTCYQMGSSG